MTTPTNAEIRAGLTRVCTSHMPSKPDSDGEIWCIADDMEWPCEAFRQALLNLQFERLFDVIRIWIDAADSSDDNIIIRRPVYGNPQGQGEGR